MPIPAAWALTPQQKALLGPLLWREGATIDELARRAFGRSGPESEGMTHAQLAMMQRRLARFGVYLDRDLTRRWRVTTGLKAAPRTLAALAALRGATGGRA